MMQWPAFRDLSIRTKLIFIMLAASLPALLGVSAALLVYDVHQVRQQMNEELGALTQLLGDRSSAALVFGDRQLARDNLVALRGLPHIASACLYGEDRTLFSMYVRETSGSGCSATFTDAQNAAPPNVLQVSQNVLLEERLIGRVMVTASPQLIEQRIWQRLVSGAFVLVVAVLLTAGLGFWMQRVIARPIERVTAVAAAIESSGDAQLRAPVPGQDEIGQLARAFNAMLDALQLQHRQQMELEVRFRTLVEQAGDAIFLHDTHGHIIDANQQACRNLGYTREELLKLSVSDIEAEVKPEQAQAIWNGMQSGAPVTVEGMHRRKNGSVFPVEVRVGLFETNGEQCVLAIVRDISERRQAEAALRTSEVQLRSTLDNTPGVAVQWFDRGGRVLYWNRASERLYAIPSAQAVGKTMLELLHTPEQFREFLSFIAMLEKDGVPYGPAEIDIRSVHGAEVSVLYTMFMIPGSGDEPIFVCMDVDISEHKRAEAELVRHREHLEELVELRTAEMREQSRILDEIHDSVVTTDLDGHVTSWNKGAERLYGYRADEAIGQPIAFLYPRDEQAFLREQVIAPLLAHGQHEIDVRVCRKNGAEFTAHLSLSLLYGPDGRPRGMASYSLDISERKRAEALAEQRALALTAANRELEAFSYSVSHDLRAPLRAIDGFSRIVLEDHGAQLDAEARAYLERVRNAVQRMGVQIDELLELSRVGRAEMRRTDVDLTRLANEVVEQLRAGDPARTVQVMIAPELAGRGDERLLRLVLENLLGNAWKYTRHTADARVEFGSREEGGESAYFVRDNGAGFDMTYVDKLYKPFQRLHRADDYEGTGVGLAIVARIVTRHGGRVWAEGQVGKGATFFFTLPGASDAIPPY